MKVKVEIFFFQIKAIWKQMYVTLRENYVCWFVSVKKHKNRYNIYESSDCEAVCSQEEGPKKGFVMGSRTRGVQETLEKCI